MLYPAARRQTPAPRGRRPPAACPQANQARLLATAEVARLLATPADLKRLSSLREDVLAKQQVGVGSTATGRAVPCCLERPTTRVAAARPHAPPCLQTNKAQLSAAVASQVEATKSGLDMLARAHQARLPCMVQHHSHHTRPPRRAALCAPAGARGDACAL